MDAGGAGDLQGKLANLARVVLTVSGAPFPISCSSVDPRVEFFRVFSSSSSSASSRSPSDRDVWKGFEANACAYGTLPEFIDDGEPRKLAYRVSSGEEA